MEASDNDLQLTIEKLKHVNDDSDFVHANIDQQVMQEFKKKCHVYATNNTSRAAVT